MDLHTYTAADLVIERSLTDWGSPQAVATVQGGPLAGEVYRLRSAKGLDLGGAMLDPEHDHYMLDLLRNRHGHGVREADGWYGSYPTDDLDTAIGFLPETLNEWVADEADRWQISSALHELREAIGEAVNYDTRRSRHSLRERWPRVRQLVLAAEMQLYPRPEVPPLPLPPRHSFHAPILRLEAESSDHRVLGAGGEYLLGAPSVAVALQRGHVSSMVGQIFGLQRDGHLVWAYGWVNEALLAAKLVRGELFLSAELNSDDTDYSGGAAVWHGGKLRGALVLAPDQNPWGGWS